MVAFVACVTRAVDRLYEDEYLSPDICQDCPSSDRLPDGAVGTVVDQTIVLLALWI